MADGLPRGQFLGVDLSPQQIALGRDRAATARLPNVRLEARDILALDSSLGPFDFVIAHGVYSWTTDEVRDKILALCRELLAPHGVAYVNYNTYPGWHLQGMLRDMLYFHAQSFAVAERVREARRMLEFLNQTLPSPSTPFGGLIRSELDAIQRNSDAYLFHAYLNVVNQPVYLSEFQRRAAEHGLRYLGDAEPEATWPEFASPAFADSLKQLTTDELRWPQYFDFIRFTTSRRSLLCHQETGVERGPSLAALRELHVSAPLRPKEGTERSATAFVTPSGRTVSTNEPRLRVALQLLAEAWPASIPYTQLAQQVEVHVATVPSASLQPIEAWQRDLLRAFCNRIVELSVQPSRCSQGIASRPVASPLARLQAAEMDFAANRRHETVRLNDFERRCLSLLDGSRTIEEISRQLGGDARESLARLSASGLLSD
jgi:methyltransferase-like protein